MESPVVSHSVPVARADGLPSSPWIAMRAFFLGMVLLIFVGYLAYCAINFGLNRFEDADARRVKERQKILADRQSDDAKWLHDAPSWFSKEKGIVRIPIDEAMKMEAAELAAVAPHPADEIKPAAAPAAAAASPVPSPSPAAAPTPAAGAPVPLPGSTPEPSPSPAAAAPAASAPSPTENAASPTPAP